jgi:hypothetical protein
MKIEEQFADETLYPKGLNMIPGGYAGLAYLQKIGAVAARERVAIVAARGARARWALPSSPDSYSRAR